MSIKPIIVVQGGQWGSEAKGNVAAKLCLDRNVDYAVRTGAINAGHTVVYNGKHHAMQQLPTGWVNPHTKMVIGAGAYIHPSTLYREIQMVNEAMPGSDIRDRLFIDKRCGIHDEAAESASKDANRHHRIGATGKGCSEAIVNKIRNRNAGCKLFVDTLEAGNLNSLRFVDTVGLLNGAYDSGAQILLEGTQGTLLDLHLGPYPFTTSRMTSAANWVSEAGLSPSLEYEVVLVVRTYPIRVAGNSGPMDNEIEWTDLARTINGKLTPGGYKPLVDPLALMEFEDNLIQAAAAATLSGAYQLPMFGRQFRTRLCAWTASEREQYRVAASELHRDALTRCKPETVVELKRLFEMTTVTKKLRRIARVTMTDLQYAVAINRPAWIAVTFIDYLEPKLANMTGKDVDDDLAHDGITWPAIARFNLWAKYLTKDLGVPIKMVSTGPKTDHLFSTDHLRLE